jgi:outer membrane immunogenic protein
MNMARNSLLVAAGLLGLGTASPALAADMRPAPPPPPAPVYVPPPFTWTGFYIGGNLGGAWANTKITDSLFGLSFSNGNNGVFVGGGQVGFNYQFGSAVFGVEGDFDWGANNNNSVTGVVGPLGPPTLGHTFTASANDRWMATVAGRLGYAFDRWLIYVKGGGGWVGANSFTVADVTTGASVSAGSSNTISGWLAGGGFEWAFSNNWTMRAEYDYFGLSGRSLTVPASFPNLAGDTFTTGNNSIQMATVGINYKFGW